MSRKRKTSNIVSYLVIFLLIAGSYLILNRLSDGKQVESIDNQIKSPVEAPIENSIEKPTQNNLVVEFIDVGQADSTLIITPNNKSILIDAGESGDYEKIKDTIDKYNTNKIDVVIATHPHADHIGSMQKVIENYEVGRIYMPDKIHTSKMFENLLLAIEDKGLEIDIAEAGVKIGLDDVLDLTFVSPSGGLEDLNNVSAVLRLTYRDTSFLFTGDMEKMAEDLIVDNVNVDVLKVGHHGSDTSSSEDFINRVTPEIAVISVGEDNKYDHPSLDILERLNNIGATVYRTDEMGSITIISDGINLEIKTER